VVGIGGGRRRLRHVNWSVVSQIGLAWLITIPITAALAATVFALWQWLT
jgi:PiT family inorganic phosphate transporter